VCVQRQDVCAVHAAAEAACDVFTLCIVKELSNPAWAELRAPVGLQDLSYHAYVYLHGTNHGGW